MATDFKARNLAVVTATRQGLARVKGHASSATASFGRAVKHPFLLSGRSASQLVAVERALADLRRAIEVADLQLADDAADLNELNLD
jgi:acyl transferase domain-containing protein